ncbi:MAG: VanW family protein [Veillonella sp.]|uniref:VanW family protein n=1 Tax=Veillonella sp. TaxID=1926307 RepID=UPI0025E215CF|nr:VanW family protein [Veillonella sp.]MBS4912845.1 VanW family protein [Veillonella sp.]
MKKKVSLLVAAVIGAVGVSAGAFLYPTGNAIYGMYLGDRNISQASQEEIKTIIEEETAKDTQQIAIKNKEGKVKYYSMKDLGIKPNIAKTMENIMAYGYEPSVAEYVNSRWQALVNPVKENIVYDVNVPMLEHVLQEYNKEFAKDGHDAYLTVENGNVVLHKETLGRRLDVDKTIKNFQEQLNKGPVSQLELVVDEQAKPKVVSEDLAGITTVLGTYETYYNAGDQSRTHNIQLATDKINNVILKPNEVFSFNNIVGERTAEAGYDDAPVFMDGKLVPGIGGGICQVSSTLFNTALLSGMTIEERTPHFAPVGYIPAGRDATVAYGYLDFVFKNPYSHPVYIMAHAAGDTLVITILGHADDAPKSVSVTVGDSRVLPHKTEVRIDPKATKEEVQVEGHDGSTMMTYVQVVHKNGQVSSDSFSSTYDPVDSVVVKPKDAPAQKSDSNQTSRNGQNTDADKNDKTN